jgi:hypothetical protein
MRKLHVGDSALTGALKRSACVTKATSVASCCGSFICWVSRVFKPAQAGFVQRSPRLQPSGERGACT